ncbi:MAG: M28 family peptidase [Actinomycetota bacterium]
MDGKAMKTWTKATALALALGLALIACGTPENASNGRQRSDDNLEALGGSGSIGKFSTRRTMGHVRKLASRIGVRVRGTRGEYRASRYIVRKFRTYGYRTKIQKFDVDNGTSRNVVAWWPGAARYPMVVGGHMDTVAGAPGANDNASGTAIVLEMARLFAGKRQARLVRFAAFGSEEYGSNGVHHVGSQIYVNRLGSRGRRRLAGMVSVDMIADGRPLIIGTAGIGPRIVARTLYRKLNRSNYNVTYRVTCDCSDNGPFERAGIPASFMWSGPESNYHDPSDRVANMSKRDLRRSGRATRRFVKAFRPSMLDRFRNQ